MEASKWRKKQAQQDKTYAGIAHALHVRRLVAGSPGEGQAEQAQWPIGIPEGHIQ